jgi:hypothetical protein
MYRKKTTAGRRTTTSTRTVRTSSKRRRSDGRGGGDGGLKQRFEQAAERPAKKWVLVYRQPASNISFLVKTWVPYAKLTDEERQQYEGKGETRENTTTEEQQAESTHGTNNNPSSEGRNAEAAPTPAFAQLNSGTSTFDFDFPSMDLSMFDAAENAIPSNTTAKRPIEESKSHDPNDVVDVPNAKRVRVEEEPNGFVTAHNPWDQVPNSTAPSPSWGWDQ